jgi:hypothetical protein
MEDQQTILESGFGRRIPPTPAKKPPPPRQAFLRDLLQRRISIPGERQEWKGNSPCRLVPSTVSQPLAIDSDMSIEGIRRLADVETGRNPAAPRHTQPASVFSGRGRSLAQKSQGLSAARTAVAACVFACESFGQCPSLCPGAAERIAERFSAENSKPAVLEFGPPLATATT